MALPALSTETLTALQGVLQLPSDVWPRNPVDVGISFNHGSYQDRMRRAIRVVAADPSVDVVALLQGFHRDSPDIAYSFLNQDVWVPPPWNLRSLKRPFW